MARASYQEQNLGKLYTKSFSHTIPSQENPLNAQLRYFPRLISTLVRPRQVQPEYTWKVQKANPWV